MIRLIRQTPGPGRQSRPLNSAASTGSAPAQPLRYFGDFELLGEVGRGGMGIVYKARQLSLNRVVALKLIAPEQLASPKSVERFHTEAEAAASLDHTNIVPIYETGAVEGRHYFTMKLIEGQSLVGHMSKLRLPVRDSKSRLGTELKIQVGARQLQIANLMAKVAEAVHYAHERGILHRDLKPGNILIDSTGQPHVSDFGLAKRVEAGSSLTLSGEVLGTPAYISPEQAAGKDNQITTAADIYSLGVILYELLTGRLPFGGTTSLEIFHELLHNDPPAPRSFNRAVARDLETICLKCLGKDSAKRYPTASALAEELRRFERGEPIQARPATQPEKVWRWCRRKPALALTLGLLHMALALGLAGILWQWRRANVSASEFQQIAYASDMAVAQQTLRANNLGRVRAILDRQRPNMGQSDLRGFEWRYLWEASGGDELRTFVGHSNEVRALALSPDDNLLATAGDHTVRIWDLRGSAPPRLVSAPHPIHSQLNCLAFAPDRRSLVALDAEGVVVWGAPDWRTVHLLKGSFDTFGFAGFVGFCDSGRALALRTATGVDIWDVTTWQLRKSISRPETVSPNRYGGVAAVTRDGQLLAITDCRQRIDIWDLQSESLVARFKFGSPVSEVVALAFSPDGRFLAASGSSGDVEVWEVTSKQELIKWVAHDSWAVALAFSPDNTTLATGGADQLIHLWNVQSFTLARNSTNAPMKFGTLRGHHDQVKAVAFSSDSQFLVSGSADTTAKLWRAKAAWVENRSTNQELSNPILFAGNMMISELPNRSLQCCDVASGKTVWVTKPRSEEGVMAEAISPTGTLLEATTNGNITFRSLPDLSEQGHLSAGKDIYYACFSGDGRRFLTIGSSGGVRIWDSASRAELDQFQGEYKGALSADGRYAAGIGSEGIVLRDTLRKRNLAVIPFSRQEASVLMFSPDGSLVAVASHDGSIRLCHVPSGNLVGRCEGHQTGVEALAFAPDSKTLASVANHGDLKLWHVTTHQEMLSFRLDIPWPNRVLFSGDGTTLLVTGGSDPEERNKTIRLWHAPSWNELATEEQQNFVNDPTKSW